MGTATPSTAAIGSCAHRCASARGSVARVLGEQHQTPYGSYGQPLAKTITRGLNMKTNKKMSSRAVKADGRVDWDTAIEDAETEIKRLRRRISVLEGGI